MNKIEGDTYLKSDKDIYLNALVTPFHNRKRTSIKKIIGTSDEKFALEIFY